ncbi:MAG: trehalose-phosphatase [Candidatus Omnitrophica bacterium]|nr:trehalose-phosphatase [Candidatus Omnitrophota bacterium]
MEYLFSQWDKLKYSLNSRYLFLFLDYDGTLSPIASAPHKAVISKVEKNLLKRISQKPDCKVAIISGRSLADIKKRVGIKGIIYSGNHGLEVESPKIKHKPQVSEAHRKLLRKIKNELEFKLKKVHGAIIEDKGLSLAVHFREAGKQDANLIKTAFREVTILPSVAKKIKIRAGKKVLEAGLPVEWGKGTIVLWLLSRQKFATDGKEVAAIYIGDDVTDEDAFEALRKDGITVFVGEKKPSYAKYFLKDSKEVYKFLNLILAL